MQQWSWMSGLLFRQHSYFTCFVELTCWHPGWPSQFHFPLSGCKQPWFSLSWPSFADLGVLATSHDGNIHPRYSHNWEQYSLVSIQGKVYLSQNKWPRHSPRRTMSLRENTAGPLHAKEASLTSQIELNWSIYPWIPAYSKMFIRSLSTRKIVHVLFH